MTRPARIGLVAAAIGAIAVGAVLFSIASPRAERDARGNVRVESDALSDPDLTSGARSGNGPVTRSAAAGRRTDPTDALTGESPLRRFRAVDATFGFGLPSAVCVSETRATLGDASGWIEVDPHAPTATEIRAPRYRPTSLAAVSVENDTVALVPALAARVTVRSSGDEAAPLPPGLRVRFRPLFADGRASIRPDQGAENDLAVEAPLDDDSCVSVPTALPLAFDVVGRDGGMLGNGTVRPGEHRVIELAFAHLRVRVLDVRDERPLDGVRFRARGGGARASVGSTVVSDSNGMLSIPLRNGGLELRVIDDVHRLADRLIPGWTRIDRTTWSWLPSGAAPETTTLFVHRQRAGLRIVDRATGEPITAPTKAYFTNQPKDRTVPPSSIRPLDNANGLLTLPALTDGFLAMPGKWAMIQPEGYRWEILDDIDSLYGPSGTTRTVAFDRAPLRSFRIQDAEGRPYRHEVHVQSGDGRVRCLSGIPDETGLLGPLTWNGEPLVVWRFPWSSKERTEEGRVAIARLDPAALEASEVIDVRVLLEQGTVRVTDVPLGQDLWILERDGGLRRPAEVSDGTCVFQGVLPGAVLVGPYEWVQQLDSRRFYRAGLETAIIDPGATVTLPYDERWALESVLRGSVVLPPGARHAIELVPVYGSAHAPLPFYGTPPSIALDASGGYELPAGTPRPEALVLRVQTRLGDLVPGTDDRATLAVLGVGGTQDPRLGSIELLVEGAPADARLRAEWSVDAERLPVPQDSRVEFTATWRAARPLRVPCIPEGPHRVTLRAADEVRTVALRALAGAVTRFRYSWGDGALLAER